MDRKNRLNIKSKVSITKKKKETFLTFLKHLQEGYNQREIAKFLNLSYGWI